MYKISVPVTNENVNLYTPEAVFKELEKFEPDRVFLSIGRYETDEKKREEVFASLRENCRFFKSKGFEVGVWIWAFMMSDSEFTCMKSLNGTDFPENMCPLDEDFLTFAEGYAVDMARSGVDIIMYDDDLRYGFLGDAPACICKHHLEKISELTGEHCSGELIREKVYSGGKNKYRDAYLKVNGDAFRNFAKRMRKAVDSVDGSIRLGACSCLNSWDIDGVSAEELSRILAGNTKPFFRLIGAPYWGALGAWGSSLQDSIELSRMECAWTEDRNIEIFSEGDVYPRPRSRVPAVYLEGFDTALRAAGCTDGILKYGMDYNSAPWYERGYSAFHIKNKGLYKEIERIFSDKQSVGVRVYEHPAKLSDAVFEEECNIDHMFFSLCARTLSYNSIPTVYEGQGITGAVFGESARHLPDNAFENGLILDIAAAKILSSLGVDTGVVSFGEKTKAGVYEMFCDNGNRIAAGGCNIRKTVISDRAQLLSFTEKNGEKIPMSFYYENERGQRFFVLNIIPDTSNPDVLRHYERNRQYINAVKYLSGERLPTEISGHPALYIQCKKNKREMAFGLWNFFSDPVLSPEISLSENYPAAEFINCTGELKDGKLLLSDIPAFSFVFVLLKK